MIRRNGRRSLGDRDLGDPLMSRFERMRGIEPPSRAWEARVLPLNHIRGTTHFTARAGALGPLHGAQEGL
jgi:hypothetical protein